MLFDKKKDRFSFLTEAADPETIRTEPIVQTSATVSDLFTDSPSLSPAVASSAENTGLCQVSQPSTEGSKASFCQFKF